MSTTHSISTFTVSRERQKPASSIVKPGCIPKTRKAATSVQTVLIGFTTSLPLITGSAARTSDPKMLEMRKTNASSEATPSAFPASKRYP